MREGGKVVAKVAVVVSSVARAVTISEDRVLETEYWSGSFLQTFALVFRCPSIRQPAVVVAVAVAVVVVWRGSVWHHHNFNVRDDGDSGR